jgi:transketolase
MQSEYHSADRIGDGQAACREVGVDPEVFFPEGEADPGADRGRVSVEADVPMGWREFVGDAGRIAGLNHYGASAAYTVLYEQFGLTADAVVAAARNSLAAAGAPSAAPSGPESVGVLRNPTGDR